MATSMIETRPCPECKKPGMVLVPEEGRQRWVRGAMVQHAFPDLSVDLREQILSGYHPECWESAFGGLDESLFE